MALNKSKILKWIGIALLVAAAVLIALAVVSGVQLQRAEISGIEAKTGHAWQVWPGVVLAVVGGFVIWFGKTAEVAEHMAAWKMTPGKFLEFFFMYLFAIICLIPLVWLVRTAFIPKALELKLFAVGWLPTLDNFGRIWTQAPWGNYYLNTIIVVCGVLAAQFVTITMAGYAFARIDFHLKNTLFILFLTQIMIAADVLILPNYKTISRLGLANTLLGAMMPFFASAMGTFLMRQTIKTIPYELEEAAKIDGCNLFRTIVQIYMPLLVPCFIAHGLIAASYQWNNFLWPLIVINSPTKRLLTVGLAIFAQASEIGALWSDTCAATLLTVAPLLILFLFFQKRFIESFAYSGIK